MNDMRRGLLVVGIKLVGLWLFVHGAVGAVSSSITGATYYRYYTRLVSAEPWKAPEGISENLAKDLAEKWRMDTSMQKITYQTQVWTSCYTGFWNAVLLIVGLYMCRSGKLVLRFLGCGEEEAADKTNTSTG